MTFFWSGAAYPLHTLSNLSQPFYKSRFLQITWPNENYIPKHLHNVTCEYITREHAFQSLKSANLDTAKMFMKDGIFSDWNVYKSWPTSLSTTKDIKSKTKRYWKKKNNKGIIAKMASSLKPKLLYHHFGAKLAKLKIEYNHEMYKVWKIIFMAFFVKDSNEWEILMKTKPTLLYEFGRRSTHTSYWSCKINKTTNEVIGQNAMGKFLTKFRDEFENS